MTLEKKIPWILAAVVGVAFFLRLAALTFALPLDVAGDEFVHVVTSFTYLSDHTLRTLSPLSYTPSLMAVLLTPLVLVYGAGGMLAGTFAGVEGFREFATLNAVYFIALLRAISALFGVGAIMLIYLIARRITGVWGARVAALLAVFDFWFVHESQLGHFWMPALTLTLLAWHFLLRVAEDGKKKWQIFSALSMAAGFWMGYFVILLVPWLFLAHWAGKALRTLWISTGLLALCIVAIGWLNPTSVMRQFGRALRSAFNVFGVDILPQFVGPSDRATSPIANLIEVSKVVFFDNPLMIVLGVAGLYLIVRRFGVRSFVPQLLVGVPAAYVFAAMFIWPGPDHRYILPMLPSLMLGAGYCVNVLLQKYKEGNMRAVAVVLVVAVVAVSAYSSVRYTLLLAQGDTRVVARSWVITHVPKDASVYVDTQYFELQKNLQTLEYLNAHAPDALRARDRALLAAPQKIPTPSYNTMDLETAQKVGLSAKDFTYLVIGFTDPATRPEVPPAYTLVYSVYPRTPNQKLDDLILNPTNPAVATGAIDRLGPYVEIYARVE